MASKITGGVRRKRNSLLRKNSVPTSAMGDKAELEVSELMKSENGQIFVERQIEDEADLVEITDGVILPAKKPNSQPERDSRKTTKATGMSVRCHCNLASCVANNYMCKSEVRVIDGKEYAAGCFVEELETEGTSSTSKSSQLPVWNGRVTTARRGCVDLLSKEKQERCSRDTATGQLYCCNQDMCNWPKSFYPNPVPTLNYRPVFDPLGNNGLNRHAAGVTPNLDHQVWLRAAVIAVPICGLFILIALIIVARRLLQTEDYKDPDGRRHRPKSSSSASALPPHFTYNPYNPTNGFIPHSNSILPSIHNPSSSLIGPSPPNSQRNVYTPALESSFEIKPGYATETSELLSTPSSAEYQLCVNCHGHGSRQTTPPHHRRSQNGDCSYPRSSNNNTHGQEHKHCHCTRSEDLERHLEVEGLLHADCASDTDESVLEHPSRNRPEFVASSPAIVSDGGNKFTFLSKLGLSKSTENTTNDSFINNV